MESTRRSPLRISARGFGSAALLALAMATAVPALIDAALGPRYGGQVKVGLLDLPPSLEPTLPIGTGERLTAVLVHETLVGLGEDGQVMPNLAQTWATGAGGREWTLVLRDGLRFHDGSEVTADDGARSLRRFLRSPSPAAAAFAAGVEGGPDFRARAREDLPGVFASAGRIVLRFAEPRPQPLAPLASPAAAVTSARGVGCGPFVPSLHIPGKRLLASAFTSHVRGRPLLDGVDLGVFPTTADLQRESQAGRLDLAAGESGIAALSATLLLVLDPSRAPFDRAEARLALASAIDGADLVRHLIPNGDAARTLLVPGLLPPLGVATESGQGPLPPVFSLTVDTSVAPLVSQRILAYLSARGTRVDMRPTSPSLARTGRTAARLILFCPEVAEPGLALAELMTFAHDVPAARTSLEAALREGAPDARRVHLYRAEAALRADGTLLPLASVPMSFGTRVGLHGARVDAAGRLILEDVWIEP